ncbi:ABC transporter permease [Mammaliicoccus sciuri]|uniref:lmo0954 family membrane protein n=1 Tax=Sporosarcina TaxID=1569 RepID=UPI001C8E1534|nr:ABC transporter permease [Sporosarcina aquimarina]MBY0223743.1 ABC transporter permease [Sporosarcina aquimarina]
MKKFGLVVLGIIAGITLVANLGPMIALAISGVIAFFSFHYWRKSQSTFAKVFWMIVLVCSLISSVSNIPAFIGIIALIGMYYVWRKWNERDKNPDIITESDDPFKNFERQWNELTK